MFFLWPRFLALKNHSNSQLAQIVENEDSLDLPLKEVETPFNRCLQGLDFIFSSRFNTWTGILLRLSNGFVRMDVYESQSSETISPDYQPFQNVSNKKGSSIMELPFLLETS